MLKTQICVTRPQCVNYISYNKVCARLKTYMHLIKYTEHNERFEFIAAILLKTRVLWNVTLYQAANIYRHFEGKVVTLCSGSGSQNLLRNVGNDFASGHGVTTEKTWTLNITQESRSSSAGIGWGLDGRGVAFRFPAGANIFLLPQKDPFWWKPKAFHLG